MRVNLGLYVATAIFLLAGCHRTDTNNSGGTNATTDGNAVTRDWLVGRWITEGGACADGIQFNPDGSYPALSGSTWALNGTQLTITIPGTPPQMTTVSRNGADGMRQTVHGGSVTEFTRCH